MYLEYKDPPADPEKEIARSDDLVGSLPSQRVDIE